MWLSAEINKNPDCLVGIFSDEDMLRIARTINKENDEWVCARIAYEITLGGIPSSNNQEPVLARAIDVLEETYLKSKKDTPEKTRLENLQKKLKEVYYLIDNQKIYDLISSTGEELLHDLDSLKKTLPLVHNAVYELLYDNHTYNKARIKGWTTLSAYKRFLRYCAHLYCELTGKDFTSEFYRDEENETCTPITEGTRFLHEFHNLLNRTATSCSCKNFTDSNFATACSQIRTELNKEKSIS